MSLRLISRSPALQRLQDEGFDIEIRAGHLLVKNVPYVNSKREVVRGVLVTPLTLAGDVAVAPQDHVVMFVGEYPCRADGTPIESIRNSTESIPIAPGLVASHRFSNKPTTGPDKDYYEKMVRYTTILSSQAEVLDPNATARVNRFVECLEDDSVFTYIDTASSNAGIATISSKLEVGRVGIVGLGGTGSYVLDLVAKTPVRQIHLFDGDVYLQHNAFRSPGAASADELRTVPLKVAYLADRYSKMHRGIVPHPYFVDSANVAELQGMAFVFLCLDWGHAKRDIVGKLLEWQVPFIDVGMGVDLREDSLGGVLRVTTVTPRKSDHVARCISFTDADPDADYSRNIQIADLNALAAALAVLRWKKHVGFYQDLEGEHHCMFTLDTNVVTREEVP